MKGVLEGVRILELGNFISGPYGACLLADMGAEVIKVENPKGGDPFRGWDLGGDQPNFWAFNRGKKSVTLNLQTAEGKEIFYALVKKADVVMENYRPGVTKKLAIDYETLRGINERIICCSITGTGPTGPYVNRPAYDTVGQGLGGMLSVLMEAKNPRPIGPAFADSLSGMFSAIGVLGALVARAQTGKGQQIDATMAGSVLGFLIAPATETLAHGQPPGPYTRPRQSQTYAFSGSDGLPFAIHLSSPQKFWEGLCKAVGHPEMIEDSRFKTRPDRRKNYDELSQTFAEFFREKPRAYWMERLEANDVPHTPVYNLREVFEDRQLKHMGMEIQIERKEKPTIRTVKFPLEYSETKIPHPTPPPDLGEHNGEFLKSLGYDEKKIAEFKEKGVI
ncbi:MAG TPA: CaiB/BaiF CoA-transferase family protein [Candidatus Udaeobacter sp.]|jgi:crotonobetainyl-CoA:carnitine CoA-transferase CaiB-like acyl-CoA transferase|nr:CaiB/BaiF CoA-transferase family protein [Candidatus Udaeobacter sp.]